MDISTLHYELKTMAVLILHCGLRAVDISILQYELKEMDISVPKCQLKLNVSTFKSMVILP
jgi:hypothetical protein